MVGLAGEGKTLQKLTLEDLDQMVAADAPHNAACKARYAAQVATYDRAMDAVIAVLGVDHSTVRTLMRNRPTYQPEDLGRKLRDSALRMQRDKAAQDRQKQEEQRRSLRERAKRARKYLEDARAEVPPMLGLTDYVQAPGADAGMIEFAHNHWYSSQKTQTLFHGDGFVANFAGRTACTEECRGWDGEAHRCECGAHRVCWDEEGDFDEPHSYVYARTC